MEFVKVHGAGNDFVLLPDLDDRLTLEPGLVRALTAPHLGLGADGVIRLGGPRPGVEADVYMDYRNADGSLAEMCGNGVRCVAKYLADRGLANGDLVRVDTRGGVKPVTVERGDDGLVVRARVDMGPPAIGKVALPVTVAGEELLVTTLSMGNPHAVLEVDKLDAAPLGRLGTAFQDCGAFPDGTNVEVIADAAPGRLRGRIWERGVGETLASGTGAAAMGVAAHLLGRSDRRVNVALPGGELIVHWAEDTVWVTGPAVEVASGTLDMTWLTSI